MPNNIVVPQNVKKVKRVLQNIEKEKAYEFAEIVKQAYKPNPEKKDLEELQKWLDQYPELWRLVFDMSQVIEKNLISQIVSEKAVHLAMEKNADDIRQDLGYEDGSTMERMLIDNIVLSWLRCQAAEFRLVLFMGQNSVSTSTIAFWEKRLSVAQGRYLRACETLARIRKLSLRNPLLQVNIATQSGQQVNVAGDLIKK